MNRRWLLCCACGVLTLLASVAVAQSAEKTKALTVKELAARINQHVQARWNEDNVQPAPIAQDAEFLRRLYLDVRGRIPLTSEVHRFLEDKSPDKRWKEVELLLQSSGYVNHVTNTWQAILVPPSGNRQAQFYANQMSNWLKKHFLENTGYDKMVRELLTAPAIATNVRGQNAAQRQYDRNVVAFYQANQLMPENVASATARIFLGVKLECAQCHDHPFAEWSRNQFWEYTAFFGGMQPQRRENNRFVQARDDPKVHEIKVGDTERVVQAKFLDGGEPKWEDGDSREVLAAWVTSPKNPFFAKATVNRMWEHFFGTGLVDPVDEMNAGNEPSHPALLDELADQFVKSGYDFQYLIRAITASQAYQLTSVQSHESQEDATLFAKMSLKGMTPDQLVESLTTATGFRSTVPVQQQRVNFGFNANNPIGRIREKFANATDKRTEHQTSILQALTMMNGGLITDSTSLQKSETLMGISKAPFMKTREKIEALYVAALSRKPTSAERERLAKYVDAGGPSGNSEKAMADVFWALLNSSEFMLNH